MALFKKSYRSNLTTYYLINKKIVQHWYFEGEPEESIVTFKLHPGKRPDSTSIELSQTNIPDEAFEDMIDGWNDIYFASLEEFFEEEE